MSAPMIVHRGRGPKLSLWQRLRRRCRHTWSELVLTRRKARHRRALGPPSCRQAAFVFGCQRSGTNMVLRTLARSLDVDRVEESDARAFIDCRIRDFQTRQAVIERSSARCVLFKPICDSHRALHLYREHPGSKGIWVYRHYSDVAGSAVRYWGDQTRRYMEALLQGGGDWGVAQWNREGLTEECLREVAEAARDGMNVYEAAALFWYMRNHTFFDQALYERADTVLARYEHLVTEPFAEFQRLWRFLDVAMSDDMASMVSSASLGRSDPPPLAARVREMCDAMLERLDAVRTDPQRQEARRQPVGSNDHGM